MLIVYFILMLALTKIKPELKMICTFEWEFTPFLQIFREMIPSDIFIFFEGCWYGRVYTRQIQTTDNTSCAQVTK